MVVHHFVTKWSFRAPIDTVWKQIVDVVSYPDKWPAWKSAVLQGPESELRLGSVVDNVARGLVPYTARFTFEMTALHPPTLLECESSGDLVGKVRWVLEPCRDSTMVTSYWEMGTSIGLFDFLAKVPFGRAIMKRHHDFVMAQGYQGFKNELEYFGARSPGTI